MENLQKVDIDGHGFCCICAGCGKVIGSLDNEAEPRWADLAAEPGTYYCETCKNEEADK